MTSLLASQRLFHAVSPLREMGAYEALWDQAKASFKVLADRFRSAPGSLPSDFVDASITDRYLEEALGIFERAGVRRFGIRVNGAGDYPIRLRDAVDPLELLYYQGRWELIDAPRAIAVVGTRTATDSGTRRATQLVRDLVQKGVTIVSGLARGIDTIAHEAAIEAGGSTIAVIGTPLSATYPPENRALQERIAQQYLLISQVPACRYSRQAAWGNRLFFPARNITMSALTDATLIVEASDTSGTLIQARAALAQGRKLFILDSCFADRNLIWPHKFAERGAIRVSKTEDILSSLGYE
jgi:DNA processing protein